MLYEFYQAAFRKKLYHTLGELQADLDTSLHEYNDSHLHSGKHCFGKTPMQTFLDRASLAKEKVQDQAVQTVVHVG